MKTAARGTRQRTSTAQTALRLKTASTCAASTIMWRRRHWREVRFSAGPAAEEDGHGDTDHSAGQIREEEEEKNPQHARPAQDPDGGETMEYAVSLA